MTTYESRLHRFFDLQRLNDHYLKTGLLTQAQFDQVIEHTVGIRRLHLPGLDWLLMDHLLGGYRHIGILDHCAALSAGLRRPFKGMLDLFSVMADLEVMPPSSLNRTTFYRPPDKPGLLGNVLNELGLISNVELQRALGVQAIIGEKAGARVAIGQICRSLSNLSVIDFFQAMGIQVGIPFVDLDESAPAIWAAAASRCPPPSGKD